MGAALDNLIRLLLLAFPAALGAVTGAAGLFEDPRAAVRVLNGYALTIGFPSLVLKGLLEASSLPTDAVFLAIWPLGLVIALLAIRLLAPREQRGTLALVTCFGNVAYLGLPYVMALHGPSAAGPAALAVSVHVTLAVTVGPLLLSQWSADARAGWREAAGRALRLPLFWAPIVGLSARALPAGGRALALEWISPLAASAAPVALFVIGLYVFLERRRLSQLNAALITHVALRQLVAPMIIAALGVAAVRAGLLSAPLAQIHVTLACMPAAITGFAIAERAKIGESRVAAAVVWSSALSLLLLPAWSWLASALL